MNFPWFILFAGYLFYLVQRTQSKDIDCGSHFTSKTGSFSSPGYPKQYSPNLLCVWTVQVTGSNPEIRFTFRKFNLSPKTTDGECLDFIAVFSGTVPIDNKLVGKYCGAGLPSSLLVKEHAAYVQFVSNEDAVTGTGFVINFSASSLSSTSSITTSQATAGIVAAIFCGIVFLGVGAMRCVMMGACQRCQNETPENRECIGTNETVSNYVMDCPPSYRTVMEHPERYPTPSITPHISPLSTPRASREQHGVEEVEDGEPPPPYSRVIPANQATVDEDIDIPGTGGQNVRQTCVDVERMIPANNTDNGDDIETVIVHSNPRDIELNQTDIERTERTSANRQSIHSISSHENPVSLNSSDLHSLEELNSDIGNNRSDDRQLPGATVVDPINTCITDSNGSISIVDHNNEPMGNDDEEDDDNQCFGTKLWITELQGSGHVPGRKSSIRTHNHSTQTDVALNRGGHSVWL